MPADEKPFPYFVPYKRVEDVIGVRYSRQYLREMIQKKTFPAPFQVTERRIAWKHSDLLDWVEKRYLRAKCLAERRARKMAERNESARSILGKSVTRRVLIESDEQEQRV
jgi:predicted DNA-binding transcriptional regulator AlpA